MVRMLMVKNIPRWIKKIRPFRLQRKRKWRPRAQTCFQKKCQPSFLNFYHKPLLTTPSSSILGAISQTRQSGSTFVFFLITFADTLCNRHKLCCPRNPVWEALLYATIFCTEPQTIFRTALHSDMHYRAIEVCLCTPPLPDDWFTTLVRTCLLLELFTYSTSFIFAFLVGLFIRYQKGNVSV